MLEQLKYLVKIQILEDKKNQLLRIREETPKSISELEKEFGRFEGEYLLRKAEYDHALKMRKAIEQDIADLESKSTRSKQRMTEVKTNKEYQAMLKEIEDAKAEVAQREDSILELMEKIELLSRQTGESETELEKRRAELEESKRKLLADNGQVEERLSRLSALQEEVRVNVEPDLLKRFRFLLERQGGVAVAAVVNGVCQVCHMNIPPQKFIELQRDETIHQCPHCYRFIYWPGHEGYQEAHKELEGE